MWWQNINSARCTATGRARSVITLIDRQPVCAPTENAHQRRRHNNNFCPCNLISYQFCTASIRQKWRSYCEPHSRFRLVLGAACWSSSKRSAERKPAIKINQIVRKKSFAAVSPAGSNNADRYGTHTSKIITRNDYTRNARTTGPN